MDLVSTPRPLLLVYLLNWGRSHQPPHPLHPLSTDINDLFKYHEGLYHTSQIKAPSPPHIWLPISRQERIIENYQRRIAIEKYINNLLWNDTLPPPLCLSYLKCSIDSLFHIRILIIWVWWIQDGFHKTILGVILRLHPSPDIHSTTENSNLDYSLYRLKPDN